VLISLFHQTIETTEIEMVFFMLIRQIRLLLALSQTRHSGEEERRLQNPDSGRARMTENEIDELKKMAPWQKSKLEKQASLFPQEQLIVFYQKLFTIEVGQKTGTLTAPLVSTIDFLLLEV